MSEFYAKQKAEVYVPAYGSAVIINDTFAIKSDRYRLRKGQPQFAVIAPKGISILMGILAEVGRVKPDDETGDVELGILTNRVTDGRRNVRIGEKYALRFERIEQENLVFTVETTEDEIKKVRFGRDDDVASTLKQLVYARRSQ